MPQTTVLVTGAASGIGLATTKLLASRGTRIIAGAIDDAEAETLASLDGDITPLVFNVTDSAAVEQAADRVREILDDNPANKKLDAVFNIAGMTTNGPLVDLAPEAFNRLLQVNLVGMHAVTRTMIPLLRPGARVVNMSSASGTRTMPFTGAYSASKFGVEALSTAMRMEFAPLGIRVTVVAPANIKTPMAGKIKELLATPPSLSVYEKPLKKFLEQTTSSFDNGIPAEDVATAIVEALESDKPLRRVELHNNYFRDAILMRRLPAGAREFLVRRVLGLQEKKE